MIDHLQPAIGRNDIDMIGFQMLPRADLDHRHARARRDNVHQFAAMFGVEMHDHDERRVGVLWQDREEVLQSVNAARRGADRDDYGQLIVGTGILVFFACHGSPSHPARPTSSISLQAQIAQKIYKRYSVPESNARSCGSARNQGVIRLVTLDGMEPRACGRDAVEMAWPTATSLRSARRLAGSHLITRRSVDARRPPACDFCPGRRFFKKVAHLYCAAGSSPHCRRRPYLAWRGPA